MKQQKGLSLIELVIVLAVIAILATIGWPIYLEQSYINKRSDAVIATNSVAAALTQYATDKGNFVWNANPGAVTVDNAHNLYKPNVDVGNDATDPLKNRTCTEDRGYRWSTTNTRYESCNGYYVITVSTADASGFKITTVPTPGTDLAANDADCTQFTLDNNAVKGFDGSSDSSVKRCWGSS